MAEERHKKWNDSGIDDHLDLLVAPVRQIGQRPHCVYEDLNTRDALNLVKSGCWDVSVNTKRPGYLH